MKVNVEVDATPEELRRFLGWPDVQPLHDEMLRTIRERMQAGTEGYDPATLMQSFMPSQFQNMEGIQRAFWDAMIGGYGRTGGGSGGRDEKGSGES